MLNIDSKIFPLPIWSYKVNPSVNVHLCNSNKQQSILTKFCGNNAFFIGIQTAKF